MRYNLLNFMKSFIIFEKNLVLKADGSLPDLADLEKIKSLNTFSDYFEEKNFGLRVLELKLHLCVIRYTIKSFRYIE